MSKKPEKAYSPMNVLGMLKSKGVQVPVGKDFGKKALTVDAAGVPVYEKSRVPEPCCILLLAFTKGSRMVPDDFHNVEKSGAALKRYVRPDGGVFLGAFQAHGESDGVVVVFGDPAMSTGAAQKLAMQYRERLMAQYAGEQAMAELGPFGTSAAGAASETPPAFPDREMDAPT